ncbi:MAG: pyridoxamine 5'-phosphate oxidase family protein, partial [Chloroflexota bacterium]|nr:pyridoxamine 5'-phosphate oxidase family protein [Chloroflexota bacterium]
MTHSSLPKGQQLARTRWNTHESGAAFDRKKTPYLTEQAQRFIAEQSFCVIAGLDASNELRSLLLMEGAGCIEVLDAQTCLLRIEKRNEYIPLLEVLQSSLDGKIVKLGLFFICHPTRERLCVQGTVELLTRDLLESLYFPGSVQHIEARLHVSQAFFHCIKYVRTRIAGLTDTTEIFFGQEWHKDQLLNCNQTFLSKEMAAFIQQQIVCFIGTVDGEGQCAINHRGGAPGFLVPLLPTRDAPGGIVLLPDYAGNGAFEAIGNILETAMATLVIPNYMAQIAL